MSDWIMIHESELLGALAEVEPCQDCAGGRGVHVDLATGDYDGVTVHNVPCPRSPMPKGTTVRLPDVDSHVRCRGCGGLKQFDVGGGIFGEVEAVEHCPNCDPRPSTWDVL